MAANRPGAVLLRIGAGNKLRGVRRAAFTVGVCLPLLLCAAGAQAQSRNVRITKLTDVPFGSIANLNIDAVQSQSLCVYANTATNGYTVTAVGSGSGGGFALGSGSQELGYEVQWADAPGQSSGTQLTPNTPLSGLTSTARQQTCNAGPPTTASLVIVLRSADLSTARAGTYSGSLTVIIGPE